MVGKWGNREQRNREIRRREDDYKQCDRCLTWAISGIVEIVGSQCCRKCEEMAHMKIFIAQLKEWIVTLQQVSG